MKLTHFELHMILVALSGYKVEGETMVRAKSRLTEKIRSEWSKGLAPTKGEEGTDG